MKRISLLFLIISLFLLCVACGETKKEDKPNNEGNIVDPTTPQNPNSGSTTEPSTDPNSGASTENPNNGENTTDPNNGEGATEPEVDPNSSEETPKTRTLKEIGEAEGFEFDVNFHSSYEEETIHFKIGKKNGFEWYTNVNTGKSIGFKIINDEEYICYFLVDGKYCEVGDEIKAINRVSPYLQDIAYYLYVFEFVDVDYVKGANTKVFGRDVTIYTYKGEMKTTYDDGSFDISNVDITAYYDEEYQMVLKFKGSLLFEDEVVDMEVTSLTIGPSVNIIINNDAYYVEPPYDE